jgi:large subunit ribosomal protein L6
MKLALDVREVKVPSEVDVVINGKHVTVRGERGELRRDFSHILVPFTLKREGDKVMVGVYGLKKREKAVLGTITKHIKNMIEGVTQGFVCKLKIVYSHFPISVKVKGDKVFIENFCGERRPRIARVAGDVLISVKGDEITIEGADKEQVYQTAANIELATKIKRKDPRVFLDGIYIIRGREFE